MLFASSRVKQLQAFSSPALRGAFLNGGLLQLTAIDRASGRQATDRRPQTAGVFCLLSEHGGHSTERVLQVCACAQQMASKFSTCLPRRYVLLCVYMAPCGRSWRLFCLPDLSLSRLGIDQRGLAPESSPPPPANEHPPSVPNGPATDSSSTSHCSNHQQSSVLALTGRPPLVWFAGLLAKPAKPANHLCGQETSLSRPSSGDGGSASRCQTLDLERQRAVFCRGALAGHKMVWSCS